MRCCEFTTLFTSIYKHIYNPIYTCTNQHFRISLIDNSEFFSLIYMYAFLFQIEKIKIVYINLDIFVTVNTQVVLVLRQMIILVGTSFKVPESRQ